MERSVHHLHISETERFYDVFCQRFLNDYVEKNDRVAAQKALLKSAIHPSTSSILIVGCGSGETAYFLAQYTQARILAVDISSEALKLAKQLFTHPQIEYRHVDVIREPPEGHWNVIFFPDVYEHIPAASRRELHRALDRLLADNGQIILTVPSPFKQEHLRVSGGLQIVDEVITMDTLLELAGDVHGMLTYFSFVSVWDSGDYIHAIVERRPNHLADLSQTDLVPLRSHIPLSFAAKVIDFTAQRTKARRVWRGLKRRWLAKRLSLPVDES